MYILIFIFLFPQAFVSSENYISPVRNSVNCFKNEYYDNCGSACDLTCENLTNYNSKESSIHNSQINLEEQCKYNCVSGCFCIKPFYRNFFGKCVSENECKKKFSRNDLVNEFNNFLDLTNFTLLNNSNKEKKNNVNQDPFKNLFSVDSVNFENIFDNFFDDYFSLQNIKNKNNEQDDLEKIIENQSELIIREIKNGFKIKKFIKDVLRGLIKDSKYLNTESDLVAKEDSNEQKKGLINVK